MTMSHAMEGYPSKQPSGMHASDWGERLPGMLEVTVSEAEDLDRALEEAIAVISKAATQHHMGIMVTRTGVGRYIVRAHPAVPYGLVRQQHG